MLKCYSEGYNVKNLYYSLEAGGTAGSGNNKLRFTAQSILAYLLRTLLRDSYRWFKICTA